MDIFGQLLEVWNNPQARHAALVHLPIALSLLTAVLAVVSAFIGGRSLALRWLVLVLVLVVGGSAWLAAEAGEQAHETVEGALSDSGRLDMHSHEEAGETLWIVAAVTLLFALLALVPQPGFRAVVSWLAALGCIVAAVWAGWTAHLGGRLVYVHGAVSPTAPAYVADTSGSETDPRRTHFRQQVQPILQRCQQCHHPGNLERVDQLDQTSISGLLRGGLSGPAVIPGHPDDSLLIKAVERQLPDLKMPPNAPLEPEQVEALRRWIEAGAVWSWSSAGVRADDPAASHEHTESDD